MKFRKLIATIAAAAIAVSSAIAMTVSAGAADVVLPYYVAKDSDFTLASGGAILTHRLAITDIPLEYRSMDIWSNCKTMTISFMIHDKSDGLALPEEIWFQFYAQQPNNDDVVDNIDKWTWAQPAGGVTDGTFEFDKEYSFTLDIAKTFQADKNYMGTIGIQIGTGSIDDLNLAIEFTGVTFDDQAAMDAAAAAIGGAAEEEAAPVAEEAPAEEAAPAEGVEAPVADTTVTTTTATKDSPDTGVEGIAVLLGMGILATGVVLVTKKSK